MKKITEQLHKSRIEAFERDTLPGMCRHFKVEQRKSGVFEIENTKFGALFYYPATNRLMFKRTRRWENNGLEWIETQFKIKL